MKTAILNYLILLSFLFTSCASPKTFLKNEQIPDDFGKDNQTLMIMPSQNKRIDKAVKYAFETYYKGKYEIAGSPKSNKDSLAVYKYAFKTYMDNVAGSFNAMGGRDAASVDIYFGIVDLTSTKLYRMNRWGNYKKFSKLYVQALEIVRVRNSEGSPEVKTE